MSRHKAEVQRITRNNYTIMLAGLYAKLFKRNPEPAILTRWVDLQEEIQEI